MTGSTAYVTATLPGSGELIPIRRGGTFNDVSKTFWGHDWIRKAAGSLIVSGYGDGTFRPMAKATRAEFASVIIRSGGVLVTDYAKAQFKDVSKDDWYYDTMSVATALGILSGYKDGTVHADNAVSRAEAMVMACHMIRLKGIVKEVTRAEADRILAAYADADQIPDWARIPVATCIKSGIIAGADGKVLPNDNLTRAEAATIAIKISEAIIATA